MAGNAPSVARLEHDLLSRLGLSDGASEAEVDNAHDEIVTFLASAPADLREWAHRHSAEADEAYALLSDPGALSRAAAPAESAQLAQGARPASTPSSRRGRSAHVAPSSEPVSVLGRLGRNGRVLVGAMAVLAIVVAGYFVYASDLPAVPGLSGTPAPEDQPRLDTARVAQLMEVLAADPNDVATLQQLADLYFDAADYAAAASWESKILAIEPENITAHLAYGAAEYNLGNGAEAEAHWRKVIELEPSDTTALAEAHYDLGFMYFSADPPDVPKTILEWRRVLEIAPDSDIAQTVSAHLETLEEWESSPAASQSPPASALPSTRATPRPGANGAP